MKSFKINANYLFLLKIILASSLIAGGITSSYLAYHYKSELDVLLANKTEVDSKLQQELKTKTTDLVRESFFGIGLIVLASILLKNMFLKSKTEQMENVSAAVSKTTQTKSSFKAKKQVFFYVIILPVIHGILILFGANILNFIESTPTTTFSDYNFFVLTTGFPFWLIVGKRYLFKWIKLDAKKYFELHGHDYVITERRILDKIEKISIIAIIATLTIMIVYGYIDKTPQSTTTISTYQLVAFSTSYSILQILLFAHYKIRDQEKKKNFKLFLTSGFFRKALEHEGSLKIKYLTDGLNWYSKFFRKTHNQFIADIDRIWLVLLSKNSDTELIEKLIHKLESGNEYSAINEIAQLMKKETGDLFTKYSTFQKFKEWSKLIGIFVALLQLIWAIYQTVPK